MIFLLDDFQIDNTILSFVLHQFSLGYFFNEITFASSMFFNSNSWLVFISHIYFQRDYIFIKFSSDTSQLFIFSKTSFSSLLSQLSKVIERTNVLLKRIDILGFLSFLRLLHLILIFLEWVLLKCTTGSGHSHPPSVTPAHENNISTSLQQSTEVFTFSYSHK